MINAFGRSTPNFSLNKTFLWLGDYYGCKNLKEDGVFSGKYCLLNTGFYSDQYITVPQVI